MEKMSGKVAERRPVPTMSARDAAPPPGCLSSDSVGDPEAPTPVIGWPQTVNVPTAAYFFAVSGDALFCMLCRVQTVRSTWSSFSMLVRSGLPRRLAWIQFFSIR